MMSMCREDNLVSLSRGGSGSMEDEEEESEDDEVYRDTEGGGRERGIRQHTSAYVSIRQHTYIERHIRGWTRTRHIR